RPPASPTARPTTSRVASARCSTRRSRPSWSRCSPEPRPMKTPLLSLFNLRRGETAPVLIAGLFFFCILTALMMLRPARDALGMERGIDSVRWLFIVTAVVTLLVNAVFGWLVARLRRLHFISATYLFFA